MKFSLFENNYPDEFKAQLEEEYAEYKKTREVINRQSVNEAIENMLYGKSKA